MTTTTDDDQRYQVVVLRVPFNPAANEDPPYKWDWTTLAGTGVAVLDSDPVSTDPNVGLAERLAEPKAGDPCPHPDCDLHLVWDAQERVAVCTADWEHG